MSAPDGRHTRPSNRKTAGLSRNGTPGRFQALHGFLGAESGNVNPANGGARGQAVRPTGKQGDDERGGSGRDRPPKPGEEQRATVHTVCFTRRTDSNGDPSQSQTSV